MKRIKGYSGFVDAGNRIPPTGKEGDCNNKFDNVGRGLQYREYFPLPGEVEEKCTTAAAFAGLTRKDFVRKDKRGASKDYKDTAGPEYSVKFTAAKSNSLAAIDQYSDCNFFLKFTDSDYEKAYFATAKDRGYIYRDELSDVFSTLYNNPAYPDWILQKFNATFKMIPDGRVTWEVFHKSIAKVRNCIQEENKPKTGSLPEWFRLSRQHKKRDIECRYTRSTMQLDFGTHPANRKFMHKRSMLSSSHDIFAGTTKTTWGIPGYSGRIPENMRLESVRKYADQEKSRPVKNDLLLCYKCDLPGYSGHLPTSYENNNGERMCGTDTRTTTGAAFAGMGLL